MFFLADLSSGCCFNCHYINYKKLQTDDILENQLQVPYPLEFPYDLTLLKRGIYDSTRSIHPNCIIQENTEKKTGFFGLKLQFRLVLYFFCF